MNRSVGIRLQGGFCIRENREQGREKPSEEHEKTLQKNSGNKTKKS
jgi:hypothetical protein